MSSTNHTPNYELSKFLPKDLPTWLGDYNGDMDKIDTAMATNRSSAESALVTANAADSTATASAAKVNQLEKEVDALKAIIAEGNEKLSMHKIHVTAIDDGPGGLIVNTLNLFCNNAGNIFYASVRCAFPATQNAWSNQTGAFIATVNNPNEVANFSKTSSILFFTAFDQDSATPPNYIHATCGFGFRTMPDGRIGVFMQVYDSADKLKRFNVMFTSTGYYPPNIFPDVSTPTIVNFNEPIDTINVENAETVNVDNTHA